MNASNLVLAVQRLLLACLVAGWLPATALAQESAATKLLKARNAEFREEVIQVTDGVYVAAGFGVSPSSMIVVTDGIIIVDTMIDTESATHALAAFRKITDKPVKAIIYTHSHGDHTGGARVFVGDGKPQVWARSNFGAEDGAFTSAGLTIQNERGARQGGFKLPPEQRINNGVAKAYWPKRGGEVFGAGAQRVEPTDTFAEPRKSLEIAGVKLDLVAVSGETADALYVWLPEKKVLFAGDNFYKSWPNAYAIRGTPYRDIRSWADADDMMLQEGAAFLVPGHTRPIIGKAAVAEALTDYRDAIRFVFDKTIEGMNQGMTPDELVGYVKLPARLAEKDYLREYYGNVQWAVRAIFDGYLGWFDGNPSNLFPLAPKVEAQHIAKLAGGDAALLEQARQALKAGDAQWAAQLCDYLLALDPTAREPKLIKADALTALAENLITATGRNYYLTVAQELRKQADSDSKAKLPVKTNDGSEANKKAALDFIQLILGDRDYEAARKYAGEYIQHDPRIGDGYDALVEALETNPLWKDRPKSKIDFKNVAADGDLVYLQTHKEIKAPDGSPAHLVVIHLFRFDDEGKIAEHWTLSQMAKLKDSVSKHPLF